MLERAQLELHVTRVEADITRFKIASDGGTYRALLP